MIQTENNHRRVQAVTSLRFGAGLFLAALLLSAPIFGQLSNKDLAKRQGPPAPNFLNLVSVGDSLTWGFRSGAINPRYGQEAYPALIARQVGTFFFLPLLHGQDLILVQPGLPPVTQSIPAEGLGRTFPLIVPQNLAIGGHDVSEILASRPDATSIAEINDLEDLILGLPLALQGFQLSQAELAFVLEPTFTILWAGSNDVLGAATQANTDLITPFPEFSAAYQQLVGTILATGSQIIVANVPDVTTIAFIFSAQEVAGMAGAPLAAIGPVLGIEDGDFVTLLALESVIGILTGQQSGPLPGNVVLTAQEAAVTQAAVTQFNAFIDGFAATAGFPVVDINAFLNDADAGGLQVGSFNLTTDFLGGIFSLDGVHPTETAQAVIANLFIARINEFWGTSIPLIDAEAIAADDQLVLGGPGASAEASEGIQLRLNDIHGAHFDAFRRAAEMMAPEVQDKAPRVSFRGRGRR